MRDRTIYIVILSIFLWTLRVEAIPPEGLEAFALSQTGARGTSKLLYLNAGYVNPSWLSDYETIQMYTTRPILGSNYLSYGGSLSVGNRFADRDSYFVRYDQTFWGQSLSLKWSHTDYRYVQAGKNTLSFDYNAGLGLGGFAQFYFLLGVYYSFNLNSWNQMTWNPTNLNTEDKEYFFEACFGTRLNFGRSFYMTVDLNNRDPFGSYNGDNFALDGTMNFVGVTGLTWRFTGSVRFTGLLAGTGDIGELKLLAGIVASY